MSVCLDPCSAKGNPPDGSSALSTRALADGVKRLRGDLAGRGVREEDDDFSSRQFIQTSFEEAAAAADGRGNACSRLTPARFK